MGHVCAPEIMHTLAAAAAGDPAYVLPEWRVRGVRVDVFIDNIRYTGEAGMVLAATANLDAAAGDFCLTWKPADSFTAETKYTFLGVDFDHRESEVKVSTKICRKLQGVDMDNVTAGQLESMGGRLMHASAVAGETPGKYWFALKFLRRLANNLNAGRRLVGDRVHVPVSISTELREWAAGATASRRMLAPFDGAEQKFSIFIDASKMGWGGVVVNDVTAEVVVMGDSWDAEQCMLHINILEGLAFSKAMQQMSPELDGCTIAIYNFVLYTFLYLFCIPFFICFVYLSLLCFGYLSLFVSAGGKAHAADRSPRSNVVLVDVVDVMVQSAVFLFFFPLLFSLTLSRWQVLWSFERLGKRKTSFADFHPFFLFLLRERRNERYRERERESDNAKKTKLTFYVLRERERERERKKKKTISPWFCLCCSSIIGILLRQLSSIP